MKPSYFLLILLTAFLTLPLHAQNWISKPGTNHSKILRFGRDHEGAQFRRVGRIGIFPIVRISGSLAQGLILEHLVFGNPRGDAIRQTRSTPFLFHSGRPFVGGLGFGSGDRKYSSNFFIERWKDYKPTNNMNERETRSILLEPELSEEAVMRILGSPIERIRLADKEIWKYSGYSLVFVSGSLKEIR